MNDFAAHTGIRWQGDVGVVQYGGGDSSMIVMFYLKALLNKGKSEQEGRPVHDDIVMVRIHPPGERLNIIDRKATDQDKKRWPTQWMQFQENSPQVSSGTPVEMLYPSQPSIPASLKACGVHTVEQLAELSAHAIESIGMGCQHWVNDATRYLQVANKGVKASELKKLVDDKDREIGSLNHKIDLLEKELSRIRKNSEQAVTMEQLQQVLGNQGGGGKRAIYPGGKQLGKAFDAQTAQINDSHISKDLAKPAKRTRARIG